MSETLHITLLGAPRSKKNSMQMICVGGKPRLIQSPLYRDYAKECLEQLWKWGNYFFNGPIHVACVYYVPDKRKRDLINLLAATHDILEDSGIIEDDALIVRVDGSRIAGVDRKNPRVEITICQVDG